jgi:hypothetical protein
MWEEVRHRFLNLLAKGQMPQLVRPLFSRRSFVQNLVCMANQVKNLTLGGAQVFRTNLFMQVCVAPEHGAL